MTESNPAATFPLTFSLPDEFREIDLHSDPATRADALYVRMKQYAPGLPTGRQLHLIAAQEALVERMVAEGVLYAAALITRSAGDPLMLSTAQFTVTVRDAPIRQRDPLPQLLSAIDKRPNTEARYVDLEVGRCIAVIEEATFRLGLDLMGAPNPNDHRVRQLQVIYPMVDRGQVAMFGLSTESIDDWDDYVNMMAEICKTIRASESGESGKISAVLG
ncbi:hypothetical protein FHS23_002939 [Prauserella isguenensis]|uniref:Uncharacterized protein n=1 Tax=Prauserella isguenensis TaxID=1470180 RepID=A0A839S4G9_9PSEU|nr:hypothetical protein [Prauserella isguenensis]MBB3051910.1 hypothetical protein [Prauserella isguenensis]